MKAECRRQGRYRGRAEEAVGGETGCQWEATGSRGKEGCAEKDGKQEGRLGPGSTKKGNLYAKLCFQGLARAHQL